MYIRILETYTLVRTLDVTFIYEYIRFLPDTSVITSKIQMH